MKYKEITLNILTAKTYKGIGNAWLYTNIHSNDCLEAIVDKIVKKDNSISVQDFKDRKITIEQQISTLEGNCDGIVSFLDKEFPHIRGNVKNSEKPIALFYKGDLSLLSKSYTNIAVIGLLEPDFQTEQDERAIVDYLVKNNIVIISGLANGCDAIAHHQALLSHGLTVAILPSSLNNIQPRNNTSLAIDIIKNRGLIITEYFTTPQNRNELISRYVERDRLQALFSNCVLLSASYAQNNLGNDSGSRHALNKAQEYNLKRAVIYNKFFHEKNPKYDLNRQIIEEDRENPIIINPQSIDISMKALLQILNNSPTYDDSKINMQGNQGSLF